MSIHVSSWAWKQKLGDPGLKLVLVKLADNADDAGYSFWRQARLADECEMSRPTVQRKLKTLADRKIIEVIKRQDSDGARVANGYRILRPPMPQSEAGAPHGSEAGAASPGDATRTVSRTSQPPSEVRESIRAAWLSAPGMIQHRESYFADDKIRRLIDRTAKKYGAGDVIAAIENYARVLASSDHFFKHRWTFGDFLTRGLDRFVPEADPENVFRLNNGRDSGHNVGHGLEYLDHFGPA